jgi:hypothetical protein
MRLQIHNLPFREFDFVLLGAGLAVLAIVVLFVSLALRSVRRATNREADLQRDAGGGTTPALGAPVASIGRAHDRARQRVRGADAAPDHEPRPMLPVS